MSYPGPFSSAWHGSWQAGRHSSARARRFRLWFPVVFSSLAQVPATFVTWHGRGIAPTVELDASATVSLVLAVLGPLTLIGARRFPGPVVAVLSAFASLDLFVGASTGGPPYVALAFGVIGAVARGARVWAWASVAAGWVISLTVATVLQLQWEPFRIAATTLGLLIVVGIGESMRTRKERFEQLVRVRAERQQSEVQAERVRIARELHDVLAHSLSQINVQAGVGLHLADNHPDKAKEALASIKETSKTALDEVRSVLGILRAGAGTEPGAPLVPEPDLSRIDGLAASVTAQGVDVTVRGALDGVPQAFQLAIYRIVQESLTNVLRHAKATSALVELGHEKGRYAVTITDNGTAATTASEDGGRGLLGMRERAELLGGTLSAGPGPLGGFVVAASIPAPDRGTAEQSASARKSVA